MTRDTKDVVARLETAVRALDWKAPVPDELQSDVRMVFNEALAGGPNMNGDGGPTLTPNHALDCLWATRRIQSLSDRIDDLQLVADLALCWLGEREPGDSRAVSNEVVAMAAIVCKQDNLEECRSIVRAALHQGGIAPK